MRWLSNRACAPGTPQTASRVGFGEMPPNRPCQTVSSCRPKKKHTQKWKKNTWKGTILKTKWIVFQPSVFKKYVRFQGVVRFQYCCFPKQLLLVKLIKFVRLAFGIQLADSPKGRGKKHKGSHVCWISGSKLPLFPYNRRYGHQPNSSGLYANYKDSHSISQFLGGGKQYKSMVILGDFPLRVHCMGW